MDKTLLETAIAAIDAELANDGSNAILYKERGRLRMLVGDKVGAMADLREALRLDPSLADEFANGSFASGK